MLALDPIAFLARARVRKYCPEAVNRVTGKSHATHWRRRVSGDGKPALAGRTGSDVVNFMQADREAAGQPAPAEADILMALEIEEASIAREKAAARAERNAANMLGVNEVTA